MSRGEEIFTVYTDGSSKGNPGPGAWAAIIISDNRVRELGGAEKRTTNNRMELMAAIEALKILDIQAHVEIYTDSEYLINGITKWVFGWAANGWRTKDKKAVLNQDLWEILMNEVEKRNTKGIINWTKVPGHSGHKWNDRCDEIAQTLATGKKINLYVGEKKNYKI